MDWDDDEDRLPSRAAQHSEVGMALGRKNMTTDRQPVLRKRRSVMQMNQIAPQEDPEVEKALQKHGLHHLSVETDDDAYKALKVIKAIPRPMAVRRSLIDILLKGKTATRSRGLKQTFKVKWRRFKEKWQEFQYMVEVWRSSMKIIEGHQGMAVVSYFVFLRSLFLLNLLMFFVIFWIITFFQVAFDPDGYDSTVLGNGDITTFVTLATTCSAAYEPNITHDTLSKILDFFQGTGWMEETAMFYGYYTNQEVKLAASQYNMPLAYFLTAVILLLVSLIYMVHSTLSNFKETVLARENNSNVSYCNATFAGMDFSIDEEEVMKQLQKSRYNSILADLGEQKYQDKCQERTTQDRCLLYTKRFFINLLIIIMLAGAGAAIYYAQDFSSEFTTTKDEDAYHQIIFLLVEFLPAIVIGLLNGILPLIFEILVGFEDYRPAFTIKILLVRAVFLRLASVAVIVISLYIQITCNDQTTCLVGQNSCPAIQCWETYIGSAMYKLVFMDFLIDFGFIIGVELPRKLVTTKVDWNLAKKVGPAVFDIPKSVLDLVYGQTLCWLGFFFAPLLTAVCVFKLFFLFYLKKLSALYNCVPPEKPYQASQLSSFFMIILMVAYFLMCIPIGYVLVSMTPSPMCGPFRVYSQPKDIIDIQINNGAQWFQTVWEILTSPGVVAALIIILILAVYYCSALNSAHKDLADMMKEQLVMEGKDKQFLLNKLNKLQGNPKKPPPPYNRSKLSTVDETKEAKVKPNGVMTVQYEAVKLYGDDDEPSLVETPANIADAPDYDEEPNNPPADYDDDWDHPTPNRLHVVPSNMQPDSDNTTPPAAPSNVHSPAYSQVKSPVNNQARSPVNNPTPDPVKNPTPSPVKNTPPAPVNTTPQASMNNKTPAPVNNTPQRSMNKQNQGPPPAYGQAPPPMFNQTSSAPKVHNTSLEDW